MGGRERQCATVCGVSDATSTAEAMMPARDHLRVSDADRDAVAAALRDHYADGRLTLEEFQDRLDRALGARTVADLAPLTRDLPRLASQGGGPDLVGNGAEPSFRVPAGFVEDGDGGGERVRPAAMAVVPTLLVIWAFLVVGGVFVVEAGRPLGILFFIAAIALLRRLFARRRRYARAARGGCGRRW